MTCLECPRYALLTTGNVQTGGGYSIVGSPLKVLPIMHLLYKTKKQGKQDWSKLLGTGRLSHQRYWYSAVIPLSNWVVPKLLLLVLWLYHKSLKHSRYGIVIWQKHCTVLTVQGAPVGFSHTLEYDRSRKIGISIYLELSLSICLFVFK